MKTLRTAVLCITMNICVLCAFAQKPVVPIHEPDYSKPRLFNDLPQKIKLPVTDLEALLDLPVGSPIKTQVTDNFTFRGVVISKADEHGVKSIVIKSVNRQGAVFTFTKIIKPDSTFSYIGRMVSLKNSDAYEIVQENGQYVLNKKSLYDVVSE